MDGREASYYLNRGVNPGSGSGNQNPHGGFRSITNPSPNPNTTFHSNVRVSSMGSSTFQDQNPSPNFHHGFNRAMVGSGESAASSVKKKKGRPRKYVPAASGGGSGGGADMSLALSPASATTPSTKTHKGRPKGSGRKQQLASLGEWMNNSAGQAFTPHVMRIDAGEDIAAKILSFAKQRPRALCILSANGTVSEMTLRQPSSSSEIVTYEGRFEILCMSGSYLVPENEDRSNRTGGLSISVCTPDGQVIGGAIGGSLIAANLVQVVLCSFVYGLSKSYVYKSNSNVNTEPDTDRGIDLTRG